MTLRAIRYRFKEEEFKISNKNIHLKILYEPFIGRDGLIERINEIYRSLTQQGNLPYLPLTEVKIEEYMNYLVKILPKVISNVVEKYSELVVDNLVIKFVIDVTNKGYTATYDTNESNHFMACIDFNFMRFILLISISIKEYTFVDENFIFNNLYLTIEHEIAHHFDLTFLKIYQKAKNYFSKFDNKKIISENSFYIFECFYHIRAEAVSNLLSEYNANGFLKIDTSKFPEFIKLMKDISQLKQFTREDLIKILSEGKLGRISLSLVNTITIYMLISQNKRNKLFIKELNKVKFLPIDNIQRFYGRVPEFDVYYGIPPNYEDTKDQHFLIKVVNEIKPLNHIQFLELYELACKKLNVKSLIKSKDYKHFQIMCYKHYQKFLLKKETNK